MEISSRGGENVKTLKKKQGKCRKNKKRIRC